MGRSLPLLSSGFDLFCFYKWEVRNVIKCKYANAQNCSILKSDSGESVLDDPSKKEINSFSHLKTGSG